ncbi:MAG: GGDEF domain-containing protein [Actinomycetales bacterium]
MPHAAVRHDVYPSRTGLLSITEEATLPENPTVRSRRDARAAARGARHESPGRLSRWVVRGDDFEGARPQAIHLLMLGGATIGCALAAALDLLLRGAQDFPVWLGFTLLVGTATVTIVRRPAWRGTIFLVLYLILLGWVFFSVISDHRMLGYVMPAMWTVLVAVAVAETRPRVLAICAMCLAFSLSLPLLSPSYRGLPMVQVSAGLSIAVIALAMLGFLSSALWSSAVSVLVGQARRSRELYLALEAGRAELEQRVSQRRSELLARSAELEALTGRLQTSLAERTRLSQELANLSERDELTGLYNRRYLTDALRRSPGPGQRCSLIILDVDHFKRINDSHGHPLGDRVLALLARTLTRVVRPGDTLARMGGEEFALLLPGVSPEQGERTGQRCVELVRAMSWPAPLEPGSVTISVGVASVVPGPDQPAPDVGPTGTHVPAGRPGAGVRGLRGLGAPAATLLQRADRAMYEAKETGRDRLVVAPILAEPQMGTAMGVLGADQLPGQFPGQGDQPGEEITADETVADATAADLGAADTGAIDADAADATAADAGAAAPAGQAVDLRATPLELDLRDGRSPGSGSGSGPSGTDTGSGTETGSGSGSAARSAADRPEPAGEAPGAAGKAGRTRTRTSPASSTGTGTGAGSGAGSGADEAASPRDEP